MKKNLLFVFMNLICLQNLFADSVVIDDVFVPQGGTAVINITLVNPEKNYTAGQMALLLPKGVCPVMDSNGNPHVDKGNRLLSTNHMLGASHLSSGMEQFTIFSISSEEIPGTNGILFSVAISASELEIGTVLEGKLMNIEMTTSDAKSTQFNDVTFPIKVTPPSDPWVLLDEKSTSLPETSEEATEIKVIRTIKANQWNTICLPFAMTEEQVKETFGEDVQLAEFMEYEINNDATEINVIFESALLDKDGFMANYPYIIKTSKDINEFMVTACLEPAEEDAFAEFTNGRTGSRKEVYGTFYGTLKAGGLVPNGCLFLYDGNFWYSTGLTEIKAFRGYFELDDIVASMDISESRINVLLKDKATGVTNVVFDAASDKMYDLLGREIKKPVNGIYIRNGKKIIIK